MKTNLQRLRKQAGYRSAREFALAHSIPVTTYTGYEQGARSMNIETAWRFADIFNCSLDELAGRDRPAKDYSDPRQAQLNRDFESLDDSGKSAAVGAVAGIASMQAAGEAGETRPVTDKRWA